MPVAYREYADSTLAPHILGTVRKINAGEYAELKDEGYGINDNIGESGIEAAMESELRGTPGELTITIDSDGNVKEEITKEPIQEIPLYSRLTVTFSELPSRNWKKHVMKSAQQTAPEPLLLKM